MRKAWFVVEAYCATHLLLGIMLRKAFLGHPQASARFLCSLLVTFFLAFLTFKGGRIASRALAVIIATIPASLAWRSVMNANEDGFDIYNIYGLVVAAYFLLGAIKLWRIKELPTRFTDPPVEPPVHS